MDRCGDIRNVPEIGEKLIGRLSEPRPSPAGGVEVQLAAG